MKQLIIAGLFLLFCGSLQAQSLSFSQVIRNEYSVTTSGSGGGYFTSSQTLTVPAGKVWKVEAFSLRRMLASSPNGLYTSMVYGGEGVSLNNMVLYTQNSTLPNGLVNYPFWLPAGTSSLNIHYENSNPYTYVATLSILEFNIVP